jgi:hypothetical protein
MLRFIKPIIVAIILGAILITLGGYIGDRAQSSETDLLTFVCKILNPGSSALIICGAIALIFPIFIYSLTPLLPKALASVDDDIFKNIKLNLDSIAQSFGELLAHSRKHEDGTICTKDVAEKSFQECIPILFGDHSLEKGSLIDYIKRYILDIYCKAPYKNKQKRNVTIYDERPSTPYITWNETTDYEIIRLNENITIFDLAYKTGTECDETEIGMWLNKFSLSIKIDGQYALKKDEKPQHIEFTPDNEGREGFYYWYDNKNKLIYVNFLRKIELTKPLIPVTIHEVSLNLRSDTESMITIPEPVYAYEVNLEVPSGYEIQYPHYFGPAYIESPRAIEQHIQHVTEKLSDNKMRILFKGWVLPGMMLRLKWNTK